MGRLVPAARARGAQAARRRPRRGRGGLCASRFAKMLVALTLVTGPLAYASQARGRVANVEDPTIRAADAAGAEPTGLDLAELRNASLANASSFANVNASSPTTPHYIRRGR